MIRQTRVLGVAAAVALSALAAPAVAEPVLRVAAAKDGALALQSDGLAFMRTIQIVADTAEAAEAVTVTLSPFRDALGNQALVTPADKKFDKIALDQPANLSVTATFPKPGTYTSELSYVIAGKRVTTRVEVTVVIPALGLQAVGTSAVRGETDAPAIVRLSLRETASRSWRLSEPRVHSAAIRSGSKTFQVGARVTSSRVGGAPAGFPLEVKPGKDVELDVEIGGLAGPGEYEGSLRLSADGATSIDVPFTVTLREPAWIAAFWIGGGALLSMLLRLWYGRWRQGLESRRALAELDERLAPLLARATGAEGRAVIQTLRARVGELQGQLAAGTAASLTTAVTRLNAKIPVAEAWLEADAMVARLPEGDARTTLRATLDKTAAVLASRTADDAAIATAGNELAELKLRERWRADTAAQLAKTREAVEAARKDAPAEVRAKLEQLVDPLLAEVARLFAADALEELTRPGGTIAQVHTQLALALTAGLLARVDGAKPEWIGQVEWNALADDVRAKAPAVGEAKTLGTVLAAYDAALLAYLVPAATALAKAARDAAPAARQRLLAATERELEALAASLDAANVVPADVRKLAAAFDAAVVEFPRLHRLSQGQSADTAKVTAASAGGGLPIAARPGTLAAPRFFSPSTVQGVNTALLVWGATASIALLAIAIVTGLNLLYVDDATWGGPKAHLIAFLWGLGLHQIGAGAAFEGVLGLKDKFAPAAGGG